MTGKTNEAVSAGTLYDFKGSCRLATAGALAANTRTGNSLEADANGALGNIDDVAPALSNRILVKNEPAGNNGIYVVTDLGGVGTKWRMERAADMSNDAQLSSSTLIPIEEGTVSANQGYWITTNEPLVLNTTALSFSLVGSGGAPAAHAASHAPGGGDEVLGGPLGLSRVAGSTYSTIQDAQNSFHSSGLIGGGLVSDAGGETVDATACEVYLRATDNPIAELLFATVPASLGLAIPTDTTKEVGVEWNAGAPQHVVRDVGDWDLKTAFPLATVFNASGVLHIHIDAHDVSDHAGNMIQRSFETMRFARDNDLGGLILSNTGTRNLALTAGAAWARLNRYAIAAKDTSVADTFAVFVGATLDQAAATQWDNANYNLGGVKTALTPNRWAVLWFWIEPEDGDMSCAYGTGQYTSQAAAEDEAVPATLPDLIRYGGLLLGRLVFQEGAATPAQIDSAFAQAFVGSAASDHGNLGGLTDDDHTQYLRADGTRAISGPMDFGGVDHTNLLSIALANAGVSGTVRAIVNAIEVGALSAHAVRLLVGGGTKFQVNASLAVLTGVGIRHATVSFGAGNDAIAITQKIVRKTAITAGGDTITLPVPATAGLGWEAVISDEAGTAGTNHLTVDVSGGANINGVASLKITKDRGRMYVYCTGSEYEAW